MATWLLAWNPRRWTWENLDEQVREVETHGTSWDRWSCGRTKKIKKGDRVFLIKLGPEPRGLIGSGWTESDVRQGRHWDLRSQGERRKALYVDVRWDTLIAAPLISRTELNDPPFNGMHWDTQSSGISIPPAIARELEAEWQKRTGLEPATLPEEVEPTEEYVEGAVQSILIDAYERNPRARAKCIAELGTRCVICNFSFEETYGEAGQGFIQVHHLTPLAEIGEEYSVDPIRDLRPVCANCHAILHRRKFAYSPGEVQAMLESARVSRRKDAS